METEIESFAPKEGHTFTVKVTTYGYVYKVEKLGFRSLRSFMRQYEIFKNQIKRNHEYGTEKGEWKLDALGRDEMRRLERLKANAENFFQKKDKQALKNLEDLKKSV